MDPLLSHLADSVTSANTLEELTRPLLEMLEAVTGLESTYLTAIDCDAGAQHILYSHNTGALQIPEGLTVPWDDTLCRRALEEDCPFTDDVPARWGDSDAARQLGLRTYLSTPVRTLGGELCGTLCAASSSRASLSPQARKVLLMFSRLIGQHIERERLLAQLQRSNAELAASALTDAVTGLPNRRWLIEELGRMLARVERDGGALAVAFIDLDGFKAINDTYGHDVGDRFLAAIGEKIRASGRAGDLVARLGGDEFVLVAPSPAERAQQSAKAVRRRLGERMRARFRLGEVTIDYQGASIGLVSVGPGSPPLTADQILAQADAVMYEDKRARRERPHH